MRQKEKIEKIACVGAGLIGQGWATFFSVKGFPVKLYDARKESLIDGVRRIKSNTVFLAENGLISKEEAEAALQRIETASSLTDAVSDIDYVQESVFEKSDIKKSVFKEMDASASADTILASSSSGILMTAVQEKLTTPERCLIAHPYTPPYLMPLVELVPGKRTSMETVETVRRFMVQIGKVPVVLKKEVPGYLGNRLAGALWREAIDLVNNDVASLEDVDKALSIAYAIRWTVIGPLLNWHLTGGPGGIEYFIEHIVPSFTPWWESMNTWNTIPSSAKEKLIKGVKQHELVRTKTYEELVRWRDEKLIKIMKTMDIKIFQ